ncbi:ferric-chelate reductase [Aspergillus luchuensis]|uniref:Ferric-chelate reductase n=1 Tax=Aspergillus kawachii TaxID=1069201 RepID=A0A146FMT5_ASPKA|nr:ferric-chelate reductase [Aspergillus luchuensis]
MPYSLAWDKQSVIGHLCTRGEEGQGPAVHMAFRRRSVGDEGMFPRRMGEVYAQCYPVPCSIPDIVPQGNSQYGSVKLAWKPCLQCGIGPMSLGQELQAQESFHIRSSGRGSQEQSGSGGRGDGGPTGEKRSGKSARRRLITSKIIEHGPSSHATQ